jgi:hypothetical protein
VIVDWKYIHAVVVHRHDMHERSVVVGGHQSSVIVDIGALDGRLNALIAPTEDQVDLAWCREFLAGHLDEFRVVANDELE